MVDQSAGVDWEHPVRAAAAEGRHLVQRCPDCGRARSLPSLRCPHCSSRHQVWEDAPATGALYTWTTTHRSFHPDFTELPFTAAVVELDGEDDLHVVVQLITPSGDADAGLTVGARVRVDVSLDDRGRVVARARLLANTDRPQGDA